MVCDHLSLRFDRFAQNPSDAVARDFDLEQRRERRRDVRWAGGVVVISDRYPGAVENHWHVRIVTVRRAVCGRNAFTDKKERLRDYDEVAVALRVETVSHAARDLRLRQAARKNLRACETFGEAGYFHQGLAGHSLYVFDIELAPLDGGFVKIEVAVIEVQNPFFFAEAFVERVLYGISYRFRLDNSTEAELLGVRRHGRDAVIGGQRDDDAVGADLPVKVIEKLGQRAVRSKCHVLYFLAVGTVGVPDQIVRRKTYGKQISHVVGAELFAFNRGLCEIDQVIVGERRVLELSVKPGTRNFFAAADGVGEFISRFVFFVRHVIGGRALISRFGQKFLPPLAEEAIGAHLFVKLLHPIRQIAEIIRARNQIARAQVVPVSSIRMFARRQNGRAVFERNADDLGLPSARQLQFIADRRTEHP